MIAIELQNDTLYRKYTKLPLNGMSCPTLPVTRGMTECDELCTTSEALLM